MKNVRMRNISHSIVVLTAAMSTTFGETNDLRWIDSFPIMTELQQGKLYEDIMRRFIPQNHMLHVTPSKNICDMRVCFLHYPISAFVSFFYTILAKLLHRH